MAEAPERHEDASPSGLPEGTLTLLFSDIEGSTVLLDRLGLSYREVLSTQRTIMRKAIRDHGGREMGTEGDSFFVVFRTAQDALAAAVQAQERLAATPWPDGVDVRVRMGLHTGAPHRHEDGYVGMDVHLAARVASTAAGGQVLLTESTRALVGATDVALQDVGLHRLKDIDAPQRLHAVVLASAPGPPHPRGVRSLGSAADLPVVHGPLVGRDVEVQLVLGLLAPGRVVTVVGPGGVGKSRLAIAVAARHSDLPDGVWFVPLARATDGEQVWSALAPAAGIRAGKGSPEEVLEGLSRRRLLLVLDNLEQLDCAPEVVKAVLGRAPGVEVLATSRSPLHLLAEQLAPLSPLGPEQAADLYVEHARRQRPGWSPDDDERAVVEAVCERVDGLPLAVELVAARSRLLAPRAVLARLDDALDLAGRAVDRSDRQLSLRSTLDWSWRLLDPDAAGALARLGVFRGPFVVDAAAEVLGRPVDEVVDLLLGLVDVSLVHADAEASGEPRFRLLRVVGAYAQEQLRADPAAEADARHRQTQVAAALVRRESKRLRGTHHIAAMDSLEDQHPNTAQALDWCLRSESPDLTTGLEMCRLLTLHWNASSRQAEGRRWLARASDVAGDSDDPAALSAWRGLAIMLDQQGELDRAAEILQRCLDAAVARADEPAQGKEMNSLALVEMHRGRLERARELFEAALLLARRHGAQERVSTSLSNLALLELEEGDAGTAVDMLTEVLQIDEQRGDVWGVAVDRLNLAAAHLAAGDTGAARSGVVGHGRDMLDLGDGEIDVELLEHLAVLCARLDRPRQVPYLLGAASTLRERADIPRAAAYARRLEREIEPARPQVPADLWRRETDRGARMTAREAWQRAVEALDGDVREG